MESKYSHDLQLSPGEIKSLDCYQELLQATELFRLDIPEKITISDYVGLRYLALIIETAIMQINYAPNTKWIPIFEMEDQAPFAHGLEEICRKDFLNRRSSKVREILKNHVLKLCEVSLSKIRSAIDFDDEIMKVSIDPEGYLKAPVEWDIYILYLQHFGFGLPEITLKKTYSGRGRLTVGAIKERLSCKYSGKVLDAALSVRSNLISRRIVLLNLASLYGQWSECGLLLSDYTRRSFDAPEADESPKASEEMDPLYDFNDLLLKGESISDIRALCDDHKNNVERPLTFLFRGASGVGKTSLAHAIAKYLNKRILRITISISEQSELILKMKYFCEQAKAQGFVLLFDEADSLFRSSVLDEKTAGWARILFQEFRGIAIFTTNFLLPYGFDRRITYSLSMEDLDVDQKSILIIKYAENYGYSLTKEESVYLGEFDISPGYYENIFRLASAKEPFAKTFEVLKQAFVQRASYHMGEEDLERYKKSKIVPGKLQFDPDLERKLLPVKEGMRKYLNDPNRFPKGLKVVFSGPPGVGKTAFAASVADELNLELKVITPSDILSSYVGETERNIRAIFKEQVSKKPKILFLDEVESILFDRSFAQRTWEMSMSNELLTRLDSYPGIVLAATNRFDILDPAFKRRFLIHVEFPHPSVNARRRIWEEKCKSLTSEECATLAEFELTGADIEDISLKVNFFISFSFEDIRRECGEMIASRRPLEKRITLA